MIDSKAIKKQARRPAEYLVGARAPLVMVLTVIGGAGVSCLLLYTANADRV